MKLSWWKLLANLADICDALNKFNLRLQESETNILKFKDRLCGLVDKKDPERKVSQANFPMYENHSNFEDFLSSQLKLDICEHLVCWERIPK